VKSEPAIFKGDARTKKARLLEKLRALHGAFDYEKAHAEADRLIIAYIKDKDIAKAFEDVPRGYA
jgi:hypothetical protein